MEISVFFIVEIMSQLKLDHYGKPGSTGRLKLDINTVGCGLSGLSVKGSDLRLVGPGFESRKCGIVNAHC